MIIFFSCRSQGLAATFWSHPLTIGLADLNWSCIFSPTRLSWVCCVAVLPLLLMDAEPCSSFMVPRGAELRCADLLPLFIFILKLTFALPVAQKHPLHTFILLLSCASLNNDFLPYPSRNWTWICISMFWVEPEPSILLFAPETCPYRYLRGGNGRAVSSR